MAVAPEDNELYVYLDFQGKDMTILRQENVYIRLLNLSEHKPIVEIGEEVYEGTYDDVVGTNLFFEEVAQSKQSSDIFEAPTPLKLQFLLKQAKILKLKKIGARQKLSLNIPNTEAVKINIKDDYRILLEKLENNKLNIEEYVDEDDLEEQKVVSNTDDSEQIPSNKWEKATVTLKENDSADWCKYTDAHSNNGVANPVKTNSVSSQYIQLQKIAQQPTRRKLEQEVMESNNQNLQLSVKKNNFIIWKDLMMKKVEQQLITVDVRKDKIEDFVDIEESIKSGVISSSPDSPRVFTKEEKSRLLSFQNFVNVSPLMKLIMLQDYEYTEQSNIDQMSPEELNELGQDGFTITERYNMIKSYKEELKSYIVARLREEIENLGERLEDVNIDAALTNYSSASESDDDENSSKSVEDILDCENND